MGGLILLRVDWVPSKPSTLCVRTSLSHGGRGGCRCKMTSEIWASSPGHTGKDVNIYRGSVTLQLGQKVVYRRFLFWDILDLYCFPNVEIGEVFWSLVNLVKKPHLSFSFTSVEFCFIWKERLRHKSYFALNDISKAFFISSAPVRKSRHV